MCRIRSTLNDTYIFVLHLALDKCWHNKGTNFCSHQIVSSKSHPFSRESGAITKISPWNSSRYLFSIFFLLRKSVSTHTASSVPNFSLKLLTVLTAVTPDWMIFGKICLCRFMKWFQGIKRLCLVHKCFLKICTFSKVNKDIGQVSILSIIWMRIWNIVTVKVINVHL